MVMERVINLDRKLLYSSNAMLWFLCSRSSWVQIHCTSEWISIKTYLVNFMLQKICSLDLPLNNEMCKGPTDFDELHLFHTLYVVGGWVVLHFLFLIINVESELNPEQFSTVQPTAHVCNSASLKCLCSFLVLSGFQINTFCSAVGKVFFLLFLYASILFLGLPSIVTLNSKCSWINSLLSVQLRAPGAETQWPSGCSVSPAWVCSGPTVALLSLLVHTYLCR